MPNKIAGYYTTDDPYRHVASNHINGWKYDADNLTLDVEFYNGSRYRYFGINRGIIDGMERSPSHGAYFWSQIRQRFPYELIQKATGSVSSSLGAKGVLSQGKSSKPSQNVIQSEIKQLYLAFPSLKKLDALDTKELALEKLYDSGSLSATQYAIAKDKLDLQRDKIVVALEKEGYSFDQDDELSENDNNYQQNNVTWQEKTLDIIAEMFKMAFVLGKVCFQLVDISFRVIGALFLVFFGLLGAMR